ncbi:hypothetical protein ACSBR2_037657 [Camellia fascicularis]
MQTNQLRTPPRRSITSSFAAKTERSCSKLHCGRWDLRATKSRQARGQLRTPRSLLNTPRGKRKRSPQPSVNSSTAQNDCPCPARMANDNDDFQMWGSEILKIFLEILVDEIKKEGPSMSKKDRSFYPKQWQTIDEEMTKKANYKEFVALKNHTGLGWDPITQTVTTPDDVIILAHTFSRTMHTQMQNNSKPKALNIMSSCQKYLPRHLPLALLPVLLVRVHPHLMTRKGVVDESCTSGSKRKSSGQGQSSKNPKMDDALQSWQRSCDALCEKVGHPTDRFEMSSRPNEGQPNNMYDPYSDDDDDVMDLHMVCQLTRDIPTKMPQRNCPYTDD